MWVHRQSKSPNDFRVDSRVWTELAFVGGGGATDPCVVCLGYPGIREMLGVRYRRSCSVLQCRSFKRFNNNRLIETITEKNVYAGSENKLKHNIVIYALRPRAVITDGYVVRRRKRQLNMFSYIT